MLVSSISLQGKAECLGLAVSESKGLDPNAPQTRILRLKGNTIQLKGTPGDSKDPLKERLPQGACKATMRTTSARLIPDILAALNPKP